jgi:hypothetical protein
VRVVEIGVTTDGTDATNGRDADDASDATNTSQGDARDDERDDDSDDAVSVSRVIVLPHRLTAVRDDAPDGPDQPAGADTRTDVSHELPVRRNGVITPIGARR